MYIAVLTYQPQFFAMSLKRKSDEWAGPIKNIFIVPPDGFQQMILIKKATTQSERNVTVDNL